MSAISLQNLNFSVANEALTKGQYLIYVIWWSLPPWEYLALYGKVQILFQFLRMIPWIIKVFN